MKMRLLGAVVKRIRYLLRLQLLLSVLFAVFALPANAAVVYVDAANGNDANDGSSWSAAFATIGQAITSALEGDDIWVKEGTYTISSTLMGYNNKIIGIYGGFSSSVQEPLWDDRDWTQHPTILDGGGSSQIFNINRGNPVIDGFTLRNGSSTWGGAIHVGGDTYPDPTFRNCIITDNHASYNSSSEGYGGGGAISVMYARPTFINCVITNNSAADAYGGGVWFYSGTSEFINCTISKNTAKKGGGVYVYGELNNTPHKFYNCIVWGNTGTVADYDLDIYAGTYPDGGSHNCSPGGGFGPSGVYSDPLFFDPDNGNFHIKPNSPCIDKGTGSITLPDKDIDGDDRALDGDENGSAVVDIGADEFDPSLQYFADIYVDGESGNDSNDGSSWQNAKQTIQAAIDAAEANDEIWVKQGTYTITSEIALNKVVHIYGGFSGTEVQRSARDWEGNTTTIAVDAGSTARCLHVTAAAQFDGFTLTGGESDNGGGVLASGSGAIVSNCKVTGNTSTGNGGGIYCSTTTTIQNCEISDNEANVGGGIYAISSSDTLIDGCVIKENTASALSYGGGGGIFSAAGFAPKVKSCLITGNTSGRNGGGIYIDEYNDAEITGCKILLNDATGAGYGTGKGGGIYIGEYGSSTTNYSSPILTNCILANNHAREGGAIYCDEKSSPHIVNCTIAGNRSVNEGSGVYVTYLYSFTTIMNSILYGNVKDAGGQSNIYFYYEESITGSSFNNLKLGFNNFSALYSWMNEGTYNTGNIGEVANFVNYEGPDGDPGVGGDSDYHLLDSSQLINKGTDSYQGISAPADDLDGRARPVGSHHDIGAYESNYSPPAQYELSVMVNPVEGGSVTLDPSGGTYDEGEEVSLTATPESGWVFDNWTGEVVNPSLASTTVTMDSDKTLTVNFAPDRDNDGLKDSADGCPDDPNKIDPGQCGCGEAETDTDSDGTANCVDSDDDNDGMPDTWEETYSFDPLVNDAGGDPDGDGYSNLREYQSDTDPRDPSSFPEIKAMPWINLLLD